MCFGQDLTQLDDGATSKRLNYLTLRLMNFKIEFDGLWDRGFWTALHVEFTNLLKLSFSPPGFVSCGLFCSSFPRPRPHSEISSDTHEHSKFFFKSVVKVDDVVLVMRSGEFGFPSFPSTWTVWHSANWSPLIHLFKNGIYCLPVHEHCLQPLLHNIHSLHLLRGNVIHLWHFAIAPWQTLWYSSCLE